MYRAHQPKQIAALFFLFFFFSAATDRHNQPIAFLSRPPQAFLQMDIFLVIILKGSSPNRAIWRRHFPNDPKNITPSCEYTHPSMNNHNSKKTACCHCLLICLSHLSYCIFKQRFQSSLGSLQAWKKNWEEQGGVLSPISLSIPPPH